MKKKENIVRYTDKELAAMEACGEDRTDWKAARAKTEEKLAADMASDPAWEGVPQDWVSHAHAAADRAHAHTEGEHTPVPHASNHDEV